MEYIGSNFQPLIHTAIAANRLTAFYYPLEYDSIWTPRVVCIVVAAIAGVAIALGVGSFPILALTQCYCIDENVSWDAYVKQLSDEGLIGADLSGDVVSVTALCNKIFVYIEIDSNRFMRGC